MAKTHWQCSLYKMANRRIGKRHSTNVSSGLCCVGLVSDKELPRASGDQHTGAKAKTRWHEHEHHQVPVGFCVLLIYTYIYTTKSCV